jgi:hypothetical protein
MASLILTGDTSGTVTLAAPAVAGTNTATLPAATGELSMLGGTGQTWQIVTGSRVSGTTYTNSTGKPIMLSVQPTGVAGSLTVVIGGVTVASSFNTSSNNVSITFIVPVGLSYSVTAATTTISLWVELR